MKLPGFTAEASLYDGGKHYRSVTTQSYSSQWCELQRSLAIPQRGGPGFEGMSNCISDCRDLHPHWTAEQCRRRCLDPGGIPGSGGGRRPADADAVCWAGYGVCKAVGFAVFRPDLWASCLFGGPCSCEDLRDDCLSH